MLAIVTFKVFQRFLVVFPKLSNDILANVAIVLLHLSCDLQLILRRDIHHFSALPHQVENELRNVATSNGDVFNRTSNDIAFGARDNMGDTVTRIDDCSSEGTICNSVRRPRRR